jgi:hypothetical protein
VHGDVDAAVEEGNIELAGKQTLAADVSQGLVENLVTGGLFASTVGFGGKRGGKPGCLLVGAWGCALRMDKGIAEQTQRFCSI